MKYWFKRRRFGWGWVPVTWQGWLTIAIYAVTIVITGILTLEDAPQSTWSDELTVFAVTVLIATIGLYIVSYLKGPSPKWRWGSQPEDNPEEDY